MDEEVRPRKRVLGVHTESVETTLAEIVPMLSADLDWEIGIKRISVNETDEWRVLFYVVE